jgi:hypothetical protein
MEPINNTKFYQLRNGGSLIFERDLDALSEHLGRPHPEFFGTQVDDQPGGELKWIVVADLRGKMEPLRPRGFTFPSGKATGDQPLGGERRHVPPRSQPGLGERRWAEGSQPPLRWWQATPLPPPGRERGSLLNRPARLAERLRKSPIAGTQQGMPRGPLHLREPHLPEQETPHVKPLSTSCWRHPCEREAEATTRGVGSSGQDLQDVSLGEHQSAPAREVRWLGTARHDIPASSISKTWRNWTCLSSCVSCSPTCKQGG